MDAYFWIHLALAVLLAVYFLYRYLKRDRLTYQLLFVFWLPTTLLTYISENMIFRIILAVFQILMFLLVIYYMFQKPPRDKDSGPDLRKEEPPVESGPKQ